jgi:hypothetical protein
MTEMELVFDTARLSDHIKVDDDTELVAEAVIASEIVHQYADGWAYKPADAIERMVKYAQRCPVPVHVMKHPPMGVIMNGDNISGRVDNFRFVKNLIDPKTQRPMRRGAVADIHWYKQYTDEAILDQIRTRTLVDVSIGFFFKRDATPGEWNGMKYDYVQNPILLNHVAAPVPVGRCPAPYCGINGDTAAPVQLQPMRDNLYLTEEYKRLLAGDPFAEYTSFEDCVEKNQDKENPEGYCQEIQSRVEGNTNSDCPICDKIEELGPKRFGALLARTIGIDGILQVLGEGSSAPSAQDDDPPSDPPPTDGAGDPPAAGGETEGPPDPPTPSIPDGDLLAETQKVLRLYNQLKKQKS